MAELRRKEAQVSLSPPEVTYYNEIKFSIVRKDPLIRINPFRLLPGGLVIVNLHVQGFRKAQALATLLVLNKTIGNIRVKVRVWTSQGKRVEPIERRLSSLEIASLYRTAFRTNPLFKFVARRRIFGRTFVYPVFDIRVIQFFNDDLSDFYSNYNNVAAFVFRNVLRNTINNIPVQFSTALKKK
jgi:hypothetical protein